MPSSFPRTVSCALGHQPSWGPSPQQATGRASGTHPGHVLRACGRQGHRPRPTPLLGSNSCRPRVPTGARFPVSAEGGCRDQSRAFSAFLSLRRGPRPPGGRASESGAEAGALLERPGLGVWTVWAWPGLALGIQAGFPGEQREAEQGLEGGRHLDRREGVWEGRRGSTSPGSLEEPEVGGSRVLGRWAIAIPRGLELCVLDPPHHPNAGPPGSAGASGSEAQVDWPLRWGREAPSPGLPARWTFGQT